MGVNDTVDVLAGRMHRRVNHESRPIDRIVAAADDVALQVDLDEVGSIDFIVAEPEGN